MPEDLIPAERIQSRILVLRGQRVLLDADLAALYGVPTKRLNEQVKRNAQKFAGGSQGLRAERGGERTAWRGAVSESTRLGRGKPADAGQQRGRSRLRAQTPRLPIRNPPAAIAFQ
jgi:hypothetical protein